ncbi:MAG: RNA methyltransferase [bacterium]
MGKPTREYIYGINPAFEVLRGGRRSIYTAFMADTMAGNPRLTKLATLLEARKIPVERVEKRRLHQLCTSKEHQGVVLRTNTYAYAHVEKILEANRVLLLDNVEDPYNVGAILRCAEVFGFHDVLLPAKGVPDIYPSVVKISAGATEHLRIAKEQSANEHAKAAKKLGYTIIALDAAGQVDVRDLHGRHIDKMLLVIGGEAAAVDPFILQEADHVARIGQHGRLNSLNASVAAGIAMFALAGSA